MNTLKFREVFLSKLGEFLSDHHYPSKNGILFGTFVTELVHKPLHGRPPPVDTPIGIFFKDEVYRNLFLLFLETVFRVEFNTDYESTTHDEVVGIDNVRLIVSPSLQEDTTIWLPIDLTIPLYYQTMLPCCDTTHLQIGTNGNIEWFGPILPNKRSTVENIVYNIQHRECYLIVFTKALYTKLCPNGSYDRYWRYLTQVYSTKLKHNGWKVMNINQQRSCDHVKTLHFQEDKEHIVSVCSACNHESILFSDFTRVEHCYYNVV